MKAAPVSRLTLDRLGSSLFPACDLSLAPGECLTLDGPSGVGKSLLLRAIVDLDRNNGQVFLNGLERTTYAPADWRRQVMYFPAESHWWADFVADHATDWNSQMLSELGLSEDILQQPIATLSSGEKQRLALIRGLVHSPQVILLDEPTANLGVEHRPAIELIIRQQCEQQVAVLWVSHDQVQRQRVAQRHLQMSKTGYSE